MIFKRQVITLAIIYDDDNDDPHLWNWPALLDEPADHVTVVGYNVPARMLDRG